MKLQDITDKASRSFDEQFVNENNGVKITLTSDTNKHTKNGFDKTQAANTF